MRTVISVISALAIVASVALRSASAAAPAGGFTDFGVLTGETPPASTPNPPKAEPATVPQTAAATPISTAPPSAGSTNAPTTGPASLSGYVPDDKYKLRVGDKISLHAPYVGRVAATDKTCKQLADELKTQLEKEYYYRATVVISLDVANKLLGRIYVWGQVRTQGPIDLNVNENLTVGKAILRAGGFGDFANKKRVQVIRGATGQPAGKQTFLLNMIEILEKGKTEKDIILQPDDSIIVPERTFNL